MSSSQQRICILITLVILAVGIFQSVSSTEIEEMCACSMTVCNCLRGNITNITMQVLRPYCKPELKSLVISDNNISQIDIGAFRQSACSGLETLVVRHNRIKTLNRDDFAGLSQLKLLDIGNNNLTTLDVTGLFSPMKETLTTLKAASNFITALSATTFVGLSNLKTINLEDNPLKSIDANTFKSTPALQMLILSSNIGNTKINIKMLPTGLFRPLKKLLSLNITALGISTLQPNTFEGLDSLEILSLQGNIISNFSRESLSNLPALQTLDLSSNHIHCLHASSFADLPKLTQLDLSTNRLTYITNEAFNDLSQLNILNLDKNPITVIEPRALCSFRAIFLLRINTLVGRVAYQTADNYANSAFAKLPNVTKIFGLGSSPLRGMEQSCEPPVSTTPLWISTTAVSLSEKSYCPIASSTDVYWRSNFGDRSNGSRTYLLIIVAICVTFLLVAFAVIMSYRAWSKRKIREQDAEDAAEKQEMLERGQTGTTNGTINPAMNGTTALISHQESADTATAAASITASVPTNGSLQPVNEETKEVVDKSDVEVKPGVKADVVAHDVNDDTTITAFGVL